MAKSNVFLDKSYIASSKNKLYQVILMLQDAWSISLFSASAKNFLSQKKSKENKDDLQRVGRCKK